MKILLIDDDPLIVITVKKILTTNNSDISIITANNGSEGIKLANSENPDLILLDWVMPGKKGNEVLAKIKNKEKTKRIPVVMLTSLKSSENLKEAFSLGVNDYINKPIIREELIARTRSALLMATTLNDLREQRKKLEEQSELLKKLSLVASKTVNSVIIISKEGNIEWANDSFYEMYEYSFEEFKQKFGKTIYSASLNKNISHAVKECFDKKTAIRYETEWETKSGQKKWIQTNLTPIFDNNNEIEKFIAVETDISRIKRIEQQLRRQNSDLIEISKNLELTNSILEKQNEEIQYQKVELEKEKDKSDKLLLNILPAQTANELKTKGFSKPRYYKQVSVLFSDFENFTRICETLTPNDLVNELDTYFAEFDNIIDQNYLEKIKTIGDSYMCAGGVPIRNKTNAIDTVVAALKIVDFMNKLNNFKKSINLPVWKIRVGVHTGDVIAGVVGKKKFAYDIWGDTVNIASRIESNGESQKVNVSEATYELIKNYFECEFRGEIEVKNKGKIKMYFVNGLKEEFASKNNKVLPNKKFKKLISNI